MTAISQNKQIRKHLEAGNTITPLEALQQFNCMRLGARIHDLVHKEKMIVFSRTVKHGDKHFSEYSAKPFSELHARHRYAAGELLRK